MYYDNIFFLFFFALYVLSAVIQIFYYLWFYISVHLYKHPAVIMESVPVSVIICARNEAENLRNFLPAVLEQKYPDYEVIVVNDCSEDATYDVLGNYLIKYPHLKISTISRDTKFTHNKKFAQFIGIKAAKNELLLFTDADCRPESDKWIETMTSRLNGNTSVVLGYGGYLRHKGLLNKYIRYDCMTTGMQYLGMAIRGIPYMGVGRNLAYRRSLFFNNKGYGAHNHIISGDDDLFVNSISDSKNTVVEFRNVSQTRSVPATSFRKWARQKKRHFTTAPYYKSRDKMLLFLEPFTRMVFYILSAVLLSSLFLWYIVLAIFILRLISVGTVMALVQKKLNEPGLILYSLIFDIFSPLINGILYLTNFRKRPGINQWK